MPITFTPNPEEGYFVSKFTGKVTDDEFLDSYKEYYNNEHWIPLLKELADFSECESPLLTTGGLDRLANYIKALFIERGITTFQTAVYAPNDLPFGIARIYEAMTIGSPESVMVFRQLNEAISWLNEIEK